MDAVQIDPVQTDAVQTDPVQTDAVHIDAPPTDAMHIDPPQMDTPELLPSRSRISWRRLPWKPIATLGGTGLVLLVLRGSLPDWAEMWESVAGASIGWLAVAVLAEIMSMGTFAGLFRRLLALGGAHLTVPRAVAVTYARSAVSNSLPAGSVMSIAYTTRQFGRLGAAKPLIAATLVLTALYSTATFLLLSLVALFVEPSTRLPTGIVLALLLVTAPMLAKLRPRRPLQWLDRRTPKILAQIRAARVAIRLAHRDLFALAVLALANWLLDVACLAAVCVAAGVSIGPHTVLLGYVAAKAAATLALIPGGLGVAEVGMAATFIAAGVTGGTAAAVVALYRLISYWAVLAAGWLAWLFLLESFHTRLRVVGHWLLKALLSMLQALSQLALPYAYRGPCN